MCLKKTNTFPQVLYSRTLLRISNYCNLIFPFCRQIFFFFFTTFTLTTSVTYFQITCCVRAKDAHFENVFISRQSNKNKHCYWSSKNLWICDLFISQKLLSRYWFPSLISCAALNTDGVLSLFWSCRETFRRRSDEGTGGYLDGYCFISVISDVLLPFLWMLIWHFRAFSLLFSPPLYPCWGHHVQDWCLFRR